MKPYTYNPTANTDRLPAIGFQIKSVPVPEDHDTPFTRCGPGRRIHTAITDRLGNFLRDLFQPSKRVSHTFNATHRKINAWIKEDREQFPHFYS
jgi:hypothetical protein